MLTSLQQQLKAVLQRVWRLRTSTAPAEEELQQAFDRSEHLLDAMAQIRAWRRLVGERVQGTGS